MRLHSIKFALSAAITAAILWIICAVLVVLFPAFMNSMTAGMMHGDAAHIGLILDWPGFLIGLIAWVVWSGVAGWLVALIYNQLLRSED